jgi:DNA-binding NarL/FixJ family response regulator
LVLTEALESAARTPEADVVVWDAPEPGVGSHAPAVLALVTEPGEALRVLRAGARGALSREAPSHAIAPAALAVAAGHWVLDESFARELLHVGELPAVAPVGLSPREHEVLALLSEGLSNAEVAERLGISRHTAKFHVNAILDKLGATTRTEAVVLAARTGLLTL